MAIDVIYFLSPICHSSATVLPLADSGNSGNRCKNDGKEWKFGHSQFLTVANGVKDLEFFQVGDAMRT